MTKFLTLVLFLSSLIALSCSSKPTKNIVYFDSTKSNEVKKFSISQKENHLRPVIAIVADNLGTETTDLIVPYGILKQADIADVFIVSAESKPITLMPTLRIQADFTILDFDKKYPEGADLIIVPAMHDSDNKIILDWLIKQANHNASLASVCEGAWLLANAGLLAEKDATTHWYAFNDIAKKFPNTKWIKNSNLIENKNIITSTGVSASIPLTIRILKTLGATQQALLFESRWNLNTHLKQHNSDAFTMTSDHYMTVIKNTLAFWNHENITIEVEPNIDEVNLALVADSWSRTYRSSAYLIGDKEFVISKNGLKIFTEKITKSDFKVSSADLNSTDILKTTLKSIENRYGLATKAWVSDQLEIQN